MAIDFPASPALNQSFTSAGVVYTWNGYAWSGGGPAAVPFPHGQCRLVYVNTTTLRLMPYNGNRLFIGNAVQVVPSAGVSLAATGLTPAIVYYIYAWMNGAAMTLEASTTGHSTDLATGVEIKTGDPTRTLVGMAYIQNGPVFGDTSSSRLVRSWFNDPGTFQMNTLAATLNGISRGPGPQVLDGAMNAFILPWSGEMVIAQLQLLAAALGTMTLNAAVAVTTENNMVNPYMALAVPAAGVGGAVSMNVTARLNVFTTEAMIVLMVSVWHSTGTANYYKDGSQFQVQCLGRR